MYEIARERRERAAANQPTMKYDTIEIETDALAEYILFQVGEAGEWDTIFPENLAREDDVFDRITVGNVDSMDNRGDGVIELRGSFKTAVITDRIKATWHHPAEIATRKTDGEFFIRYTFEDEGFIDASVEVY